MANRRLTTAGLLLVALGLIPVASWSRHHQRRLQAERICSGPLRDRAIALASYGLGPIEEIGDRKEIAAEIFRDLAKIGQDLKSLSRDQLERLYRIWIELYRDDLEAAFRRLSALRSIPEAPGEWVQDTITLQSLPFDLYDLIPIIQATERSILLSVEADVTIGLQVWFYLEEFAANPVWNPPSNVSDIVYRATRSPFAAVRVLAFEALAELDLSYDRWNEFFGRETNRIVLGAACDALESSASQPRFDASSLRRFVDLVGVRRFSSYALTILVRQRDLVPKRELWRVAIARKAADIRAAETYGPGCFYESSEFEQIGVILAGSGCGSLAIPYEDSLAFRSVLHYVVAASIAGCTPEDAAERLSSIARRDEGADVVFAIFASRSSDYGCDEPIYYWFQNGSDERQLRAFELLEKFDAGSLRFFRACARDGLRAETRAIRARSAEALLSAPESLHAEFRRLVEEALRTERDEAVRSQLSQTISFLGREER